MIKLIKNMTNRQLLYASAVICVIITIVVIANVISLSSNISKELENFSIDNLSAEDIINKEFSSTFASSSKYQGGTETGVDGASKYVDSDRIEFKCKKNDRYRLRFCNESNRWHTNNKHFIKTIIG